MVKDDDGWTGSMKRPWMNPPSRHKLSDGGPWWGRTMTVLAIAVVAVVVVMTLVATGHLSRGWAYVTLPVAGVAAVLSRLLTIVKAGDEDRRT